MATTDYRYATGDDASVGTWTVTPTSPTTKYDKIDEQGTPDDNDFITATGLTGGRARATFSFTAFAVPAGATSISVTVRRRSAAAANGAENHASALKVGGTYYDSAGANLGTDWTDADDTWATNPQSAVAWTADDVNGVSANPLQAFGASSSDATPNVKFSQVYVSVTYTAGVSATLTTAAIAMLGSLTSSTLLGGAQLSAGSGSASLTMPTAAFQSSALFSGGLASAAFTMPTAQMFGGTDGTMAAGALTFAASVTSAIMSGGASIAASILALVVNMPGVSLVGDAVTTATKVGKMAFRLLGRGGL